MLIKTKPGTNGLVTITVFDKEISEVKKKTPNAICLVTTTVLGIKLRITFLIMINIYS